MTISEILSPVDVPVIVQSLFDLNRATNHDGHTVPLISIQVTELVDGVLIGCSMNHSIVDGTSYWNFFNTWSEIFQAQAQTTQGLQCKDEDILISHHPIHNRWFPQGCDPPINLPFKHHNEFITRFESPELRERVFHFSAESIAKLKAKANSESNSTKISTFIAGYEGCEGGGSIDLALTISPGAMRALELDEEFMQAVSARSL